MRLPPSWLLKRLIILRAKSSEEKVDKWNLVKKKKLGEEREGGRVEGGRGGVKMPTTRLRGGGECGVWINSC